MVAAAVGVVEVDIRRRILSRVPAAAAVNPGVANLAEAVAGMHRSVASWRDARPSTAMKIDSGPSMNGHCYCPLKKRNVGDASWGRRSRVPLRLAADGNGRGRCHGHANGVEEVSKPLVFPAAVAVPGSLSLAVVQQRWGSVAFVSWAWTTLLDRAAGSHHRPGEVVDEAVVVVVVVAVVVVVVVVLEDRNL